MKFKLAPSQASRKLKTVLMRGGTSRGLFFLKQDLPHERACWDRLFLAALGSPDPYGRQVDGLGGATSSTSKVAVISPSNHQDLDIDYTFGQVNIQRPMIEYQGDCGNLAAAVGVYAVEQGLVRADRDFTQVRILSTNTGQQIIAHVPVRDGQVEIHGNYQLDGVRGTAARIDLDFVAPAGRVTGKLLATGNVRDVLHPPGLEPIEATLIDSGNPCVFVRAEDLGKSACTDSNLLNEDSELLQLLELLRCEAALQMGLATSWEKARQLQAIPKIALIGQRPTGEGVSARMVSMGRFHATYPVTGAIATGVAATLPGSLVSELVSLRAEDNGWKQVLVAHNAGMLEVKIKLTQRNGSSWPLLVRLGRTARTLMEGYVHIPTYLLKGDEDL